MSRFYAFGCHVIDRDRNCYFATTNHPDDAMFAALALNGMPAGSMGELVKGAKEAEASVAAMNMLPFIEGTENHG